MNHLIFTAVLTACLGIGGYQQGSEFFGPSPEGLGHDPHYDPGQLNSSHTGPWPPLVSLHSTLSIVVYTSMYYVLTYFARSFRIYNVHTKVFLWLMTIYPIITALTGFQFANLLPYLLQVVPTCLLGTFPRKSEPGLYPVTFPEHLDCLPESSSKRDPSDIMLSPCYKVSMWILMPISLFFWSSSPVFWSKLSLISQTPGFSPGLLSNVIGNLNQVLTNLASCVLFPWSASYLEDCCPLQNLELLKPLFLTWPILSPQQSQLSPYPPCTRSLC
ncbi:hypothetical protein DSO57_1014780 [Entomophthora muscae]|uniref:Uncharacterized protein n=1 Tax=Entomophthora muscae TaxID=34485 RepID=A0ACC2UFP9_9FUNG|nr:hypothetical protein DSO57_1014780 [Entomophthora muscae]